MFVVGGIMTGNCSAAEFAPDVAVEMTMGRDLRGQLGRCRTGAGVMVGGAMGNGPMGESDDNGRDGQCNDRRQRDHPTHDVPHPA